MNCRATSSRSRGSSAASAARTARAAIGVALVLGRRHVGRLGEQGREAPAPPQLVERGVAGDA